MKVYSEGGFVVIESAGIKNYFPNGVIGFMQLDNTITFVNRNQNEPLFEEEFSQITDSAGVPFGTIAQTLTALSTLLNFGLGSSNSPAGASTSANQAVIIGIQSTLLAYFIARNTPITMAQNALLTRAIGYEELLMQGYLSGHSVALKSGRNQDIDTATVPEDIWAGGGVYTGFPTGAPEELQVFSSSALDTGVVSITYLASTTATAWVTANVTLRGTTQVNTGITAYRVERLTYNTGAAATFNAGVITCRHRTTTANVFIIMPVGTSQSYMAGYTIPFGSKGYIRKINCEIQGAAAAVISGALWIRNFGRSPRLRRNFTVNFGTAHQDVPYGGIELTELTDIQMRITLASTNNIEVVGGYDILIISQS